MTGSGSGSPSRVLRLPKILLLIVLTTLVLVAELPQGGGWILRPTVLTLALPGILLIRLASRPKRVELFLEALVAAAIFSVSVSACRSGFEALLCGGASLGIASLLGLGIRGTAGTGRPGSGYAFASAAILCTFSLAVGFFFQATVNLAPKTFDTYLYAFDYTFGSPSFLMGRLFERFPLLELSSSAGYYSLPFVLAAFCALQLANPKLRSSNVMVEFAVAAAIGWMLYFVYPAVGPICAFPGAYPASPPLLSSIRIDFVRPLSDTPRNCMPSLHTAWALLVVWNSRPFGFWVRLLANAFLLLTLLATLGLGEHYLVDLVVALPFALGIRAVCATHLPRPQRERLAAAAVGFVLTAGWILGLRQRAFVTQIPALASYALVAFTAGVCLPFERRLDASIRTTSTAPCRVPGIATETKNPEGFSLQ